MHGDGGEGRHHRARLTADADALQAGIVACTGAAGCRFGNADTKATARAIAAYCGPRVALDSPVNIHVTGCHNSCAQHYIGDIGLIGARVAINEDGDTVDGYNLLVGGGFGTEAAIAQELFENVKAEDAPALVERCSAAGPRKGCRARPSPPSPAALGPPP